MQLIVAGNEDHKHAHIDGDLEQEGQHEGQQKRPQDILGETLKGVTAASNTHQRVQESQKILQTEYQEQQVPQPEDVRMPGHGIHLLHHLECLVQEPQSSLADPNGLNSER